MKHTPTPWHVAETDGDSTTRYIDDDFGINGGRDYYLVEVRHGDEDELKANAEFIARACNTHDAAVKALLAAEKLLDSVAFVSVEGDTNKSLKLIRTALMHADSKPNRRYCPQ